MAFSGLLPSQYDQNTYTALFSDETDISCGIPEATINSNCVQVPDYNIALNNKVSEDSKEAENKFFRWSGIVEALTPIGSTFSDESPIHTNTLSFMKGLYEIFESPWLQNLYSLSNENYPEAINLLYKRFDGLLSKEKFNSCDSLLNQVNINNLKPEVFIALLAITFAAKSKLPSRSAKVTDIRNKLAVAGENADEILVGLE
ncbi:MAG: hypothetical protein HOM11_02475 [Methylococcales bacterium]|jgi:hypothetical protein|nr:hypothetical protein [Methylococcales bacterium]MBT7443690.1 hypothetical protein [Methylococcales bacterium]